MNFVSTLQITKILHSKISVFMSFFITYKQALLKNLPSNESKVLIHGAGFSRHYTRLNHEIYSQTIANTHATIGKLHRTIKSNAMVVDTTCMKGGPGDPRAGAYSGAYD